MLRRVCRVPVLLFGAFVMPAESAANEPLQDRPTVGESEGQKLVCKYERPMGSLIKVKTCRTKAQIASTRAESQKKLKEIQDKSVLGPPPGERFPTGG
jgi:hypothetical protein